MLAGDYPQMDALCHEVLTAIERDELKLLSWGFVDVRSPLEETLPAMIAALDGPAAVLWQEAQTWEVSAGDILENLLARRLLFRQVLHGQRYYRSRFAETIRLLALLRQRFSPHDWQTASRLVSDFKLDVRPRTYPRRDVPREEVCAELRQRRASPFYIQAVSCLLQDQHGQALQIARFQKHAIVQHYDALHSSETTGFHERALVIGAGTGAGKTRAFYVPAMAEIAATISLDRYVRAIALYPRVELLKDQLVEAFQEARKLDPLLDAHKPRKITLGAYYTDTPGSAKMVLNGATSWTFAPAHKGWACPFFLCPNTTHQPCALIWLREDVVREAEARDGRHARLRCPLCFFGLSHEQFLLTREQMIQTPPDILFTTTEMLNRRLSKADEHHLFGCAVSDTPPPSLLLLDEIHTYEGLRGAQIAYLLRRWRYIRRLSQQAGTPLCCVGLSATLSDAEAFFARLTGLPANRVHSIHPADQDLEKRGAEYSVILKGDPVAATNLLSTSVQAVMLLARMLDPYQYEPSHQAWGQKIFAFTDKLDVINRWYQIELDAEGTQKLSQYRRISSADPLRSRKARAGQDWSICEYIGHNLAHPLRIDRTSSQDRGVDSRAQLVIATSTLEVGYNDVSVGAVVQHKAPHTLASFLQRKGRAGRDSRMRPWMVVVTSEYGRDRWAFQHAENLFAPTPGSIDLPIENYYVRKMQATFALMDWLSLKLKQDFPADRVDIWRILSGAYTSDYYRVQRQTICQIVKGVLTYGPGREELAHYLRRALDLRDPQEVEALLWEEPRSLLFEVLPTMLRQLESNWRSIRSGLPAEWADAVSRNPLTDFVTSTLFADLQTSEIPLSLPPPPAPRAAGTENSTAPQEQREEMLSLAQALVEFAPGNVSKRYASSKSSREAYWVPLPEEALTAGVVPVEHFAPSIICEQVPRQFTMGGQTYQLYVPRAYRLVQLAREVRSSSTAQLLWRSHFVSASGAPGGEELHLARHSRWKPFLAEMRSYTRTHGSSVEVARLAVGVRAETHYEGRRETRRCWLQFAAETAESLAGVGFLLYVDALQIRLHPLDLPRCLALPQWPVLLQALRAEYFRSRLRTHALAHQLRLSHFEREWLWLLEFSILTSQAVKSQCTLEQAAQDVRQSRVQRAEEAMKMLFQAQQAEDAGEEKVGRLHEKLKELIATSEVERLLNECAPVLWEPVDEAFFHWLRQCYASSLGAALFATLTRLAPDIDPDDVHMDLDGDQIWISEAVPGGIGILSRIVETIKTHPEEFDLQMQDTLLSCNRQQLGDQLYTLAEYLSQDDQELATLFAELRQEAAIATQQAALQHLKQALEQRGVAATRDVIVALLAKFLRPNSARDSDQLIAALVKFWQREEQRLQCVFDVRVLAVAALADPQIEAQVKAVLWRIQGGEDVERSQMFTGVQSLLWFSCTTSCPDCIEEHHPFQELVKPSRHLLLALLQADEQAVVYGQQDWQDRVRQDLQTSYRTRIHCAQEDLLACKLHLLQLLIEPVDIGFQFFYPLIDRITRAGKLWTIDMRIRELAYV
jgi:hypothetical protein